MAKFLLPLSLKPLDDPNHDPGESIVMEADTAHIAAVTNREFAAEAISAINDVAKLRKALEHAAVYMNVVPIPADAGPEIRRAMERRIEAVYAALR